MTEINPGGTHATWQEAIARGIESLDGEARLDGSAIKAEPVSDKSAPVPADKLFIADSESDGEPKQATPAAMTNALIPPVVTLSDGATITPNFATGRVFAVTLGGNRTLANPSNQAAGQSGRIVVKQDGTGSRTLSYGSHWNFPGGAPDLTTASGAVDIIVYDVQASGEIYATLIKDFQ